MNKPTPHQAPDLSAQLAADELRIRNWLRLRRELAELHARLEYLKLMIRLGAAK